MPDEPTRARPDYIAMHDQAAAELRPKAQVVVSYWKSLGDAGMPQFEALELARSFQQWLLEGIHGDDDPDADETEDHTEP